MAVVDIESEGVIWAVAPVSRGPRKNCGYVFSAVVGGRWRFEVFGTVLSVFDTEFDDLVVVRQMRFDTHDDAIRAGGVFAALQT